MFSLLKISIFILNLEERTKIQFCVVRTQKVFGELLLFALYYVNRRGLNVTECPSPLGSSFHNKIPHVYTS